MQQIDELAAELVAKLAIPKYIASIITYIITRIIIAVPPIKSELATKSKLIEELAATDIIEKLELVELKSQLTIYALTLYTSLVESLAVSP